MTSKALLVVAVILSLNNFFQLIGARLYYHSTTSKNANDTDASYFYFGRNRKVNWFRAVGTCRRIKSQLANIDSKIVMDWINHELKDDEKHEDYWTGLNNLQDKSTFVPIFTGKPLNYTNWYEGQPKIGSRFERCVAIKYDAESEKYYWHNLNCRSKLNYICLQRKAKLQSPPTQD